MKTNRKHGFTIVELVVVIAIIAVLAAVLIPTFASIIKKANDSAYLQERTSQQIADLAEKVENQNYLTWEDFEAVLARELAKVGSTQTADIEKAIKVALAERAGSDNGLSEAQVQKIINEAMAGQLTTAQVQAIVEQSIKNAGFSVGTSGGVTAAQVKSIVSAAIANIPTQTGVTPAMVQSAVASALENAHVTVSQDDIEKALKAFGVPTATEVETLINSAVAAANIGKDDISDVKVAKVLNYRLSNTDLTPATAVNPTVVFDALSISNPAAAVATTSGNIILWDSANNRFVVVDGSGKFVYSKNATEGADVSDTYKYWTVSSTVSGTYSTYYTGTESTISTTKGFDAGTTTSVTSVTYTNTESAQDVVIRTNSASTSLTIDAAADTVKHYGAVGSLNIIAVANMSYHEYGQVAFAEIATGRIVLESDSEVEHIHLTATEGNFVDITVAKASDVEMPEFSRDPVEIPEEGKLVVALQNGTDKDDAKDYVWLTAVGIYEQVTVSSSKTEAGNNYAANSNDQEKKDTAQQIANNITFNEGGVDYKVTAKTTDGGATWTYEVVDQNGTVSEDYSAEKHNTENTVNVQTTGDTPTTVETKQENGLSEADKEEKEKTVIGYIARIDTKYYMDAELAFNEANPETDTVVILNNCKINIDSIPNEINVITNGNTIERNKISERYIQLGKLPWSIWDYDLNGYITSEGDVEKWYKVDGSTFPVYRNGAWQYPSDREIFDEALTSYSQYTKVEYVDINSVVGEFEGNSTALKYFTSGYGTSLNPFTISTGEELGNVYLLGLNRKAYYLLNNDITTDKNTSDYNVDFNLNGHTITKTAGNGIFWAYDYLYVYNGNVVLTGTNSSVFGDKTSTSEIHASNLNISGNVTVTSSHYGALIKYLGNTANNNELTSKMYVENLTSYVNIKADGASVGGLFGYCLNASLDLRNISVYSSIETGNTAGGIVMGDTQVCGYSSIAEHQYMTVSNVKFYGSILVPSSKAAYIYGNTVPTGVQDDYKGEGATIVKGINIDNQLIVAENNEFLINADNQYTRYVIKYQFAVDYIDGRAGGYPRNITKEFTINSSEQVNTGIYKYSLVELEKGENDVLVSDSFNRIFTHEGLENTYCYDGQGTFTISSNNRVTVYIYAYSGDNLRAVGTYTYNAVK